MAKMAKTAQVHPLRLPLTPCLLRRRPLSNEAALFEITVRKQKTAYTVVRATAPDTGDKIAVFLDNETCRPLYPVFIEPKGIDIVIILYSDTASGCQFPPSIPDSLVDPFLEILSRFHKTVDAARTLIAEEQKKLKTKTDGL